ncbi:Alpha/Beta hydrolase protein [Hyaloraphidium curvatum]|nr:Alpha/Beta hydrolase protein [Hyaloraphidium curvatum]
MSDAGSDFSTDATTVSDDSSFLSNPSSAAVPVVPAGDEARGPPGRPLSHPPPWTPAQLQAAAGLPLQTFDFGGRALHFVDTGGGRPGAPPLLLVHDFPTGPHAYARLIPALAARGLRAICPTLRGYGPGGQAPYSVRGLADDFAALLAYLCVPRAVVVGQNWGTIPASHFALLRPDLAAGLVLLSVPYQPPAAIYIPVALLAAKADPLLGFKSYYQSRFAVADSDAHPEFVLRCFLRGGGEAEFAVVRRLSAVDIRDRTAALRILEAGVAPSPLLSPQDEAFLVAWLRSIGGTAGPIGWWNAEANTVQEMRGVPHGIACPVMFAAGTWQRFASEANRADMRRLCADLEERELEGAGVCPALERPDEVANLISEWLERKGLR